MKFGEVAGLVLVTGVGEHFIEARHNLVKRKAQIERDFRIQPVQPRPQSSFHSTHSYDAIPDSQHKWPIEVDA